MTTFTGAVNKKNPSRTFAISVGAGPTEASLAFAKCSALRLALQTSDNQTIESTMGPSTVVLDASVSKGTYVYSVSGTSQCAFTLTVVADVP